MADTPKTIKTYALDGSLRDFPVAFDYLSRQFVAVTLIGEARTNLVSGVDYRFTSANQITTTVAHGATDAFIEIRRLTNTTPRIVDFKDGSVLTATNLNVSQLQAMHIAEEARDMTTLGIGLDQLALAQASVIRFIGPQTNPPTQRTDGTALQIGDRYSRKPDGSEFVWNGTNWVLNDSATLASNLKNPLLMGSVITYKSKLADAINRELSEKLAEFDSVVDLGAVGDGVTDSFAAFLKASVSGKRLRVPAGDFVVNVPVGYAEAIFSVLPKIDLVGTLRINVSAGTHVLLSPTVVTGKVQSGLSIVGAVPTAVSILGQVSVSGSAGNYAVVLSVSTTTGVAVGQYLHTYRSTGTGSHAIHRGIWRISGVDVANGQITVINTSRSASFPVNTITTSTGAAISSVLKYMNVDGLVVFGSCVDYIDNLAFVGNASDYWSSSNIGGTEKGTHGCAVGSLTIALNGKPDNANPLGKSTAHVSAGANVGFCDFDQQGVVTELGGTFWGDFVSACGNRRRGMYASTSSGIRAKHVSCNGNFLDGIITDIGGDFYTSSETCACGNGGAGASSSQSGSIIADTGIFRDNLGSGLSALAGGFLQVTTGDIAFNVTHGLRLEYKGTIYANSAKIDSNGQNGVNASWGSTLRLNTATISNHLTVSAIRADDFSSITTTGITFTNNVSNYNLGTGGLVRGIQTLGGELYGEDIRLRNLANYSGVKIAPSSGGDSFFFLYDAGTAESYSGGYVMVNNSNGFYPATDGDKNLGRASTGRWNNSYFAVAPTVSSDRSLKQQIRDLDEAERAVAVRCKALVKAYKMNSAVAEKGPDGARWHFGVIAQEVVEAFQLEGLDPYKYAIVCLDEWDDHPEVLNDEGEVLHPAIEAGSLYGIRYEQLMMFIISAL